MYKMCRGRGQVGFMPFSRRQGARLRGAEAVKGDSLAGNPRIKMAKTDSRGSKIAAGLSVEGEWAGRLLSRQCGRFFSAEEAGRAAAFQEGLRGTKKEPPAGGSHNMKYVPCTILTHTVYRRGGGGGGGRSWYPEKCEGQEHGQASAPQAAKRLQAAREHKKEYKQRQRRRYRKRYKIKAKIREAGPYSVYKKGITEPRYGAR